MASPPPRYLFDHFFEAATTTEEGVVVVVSLVLRKAKAILRAMWRARAAVLISTDLSHLEAPLRGPRLDERREELERRAAAAAAARDTASLSRWL